jgi:membrane associated rhomboid family serine protease
MTALIGVMGLNVIVSLFGFRAQQKESGMTADVFFFIPNQVARGENGLGMLLAHFSHSGLAHLSFNMLALYSFAGTVLAVLGPVRLLLIYAVAGLCADLVAFALHHEDPAYRCLGASGSVFGIMMAAIVLNPATSIALLFVPIPIPGPFFMLGYAIVSVVLMTQKRRGGISHEAHLGGAIAGLALTGLLAPSGLHPLSQWFAQWL